ncbi:hypothetical protein [Pseudomonas sp. PDM04]|uniref:hypothetical protein n=1 Tax=Pseudomonas sp. PDM04 TaxID=2769296 RepID=UPI00177A9E63|nr:hypothetical protein [Pseudomonas sp. PDM04]MBD9442861.1 hypothetical protein [Pseudomonas sp. PDM04]
MTIVFAMTYEQDIASTPLDPGWPGETHRFGLNQIKNPPSLNVPAGAVIVVVAHGNNKELGDPGRAGISAGEFVNLVHANMQGGQAPSAIYISSCSDDIAEYAARVCLVAQERQIWANTTIFGHHDAVAGSVPPPTSGSVVWEPIYQNRTRG